VCSSDLFGLDFYIHGSSKYDFNNKFIYSVLEISNQIKFKIACQSGHLEIAKWLYSNSDINLHNKDDEAFKLSCLNGNTKTAQWLYSLDTIDINFNLIFKEVCSNNKLSTVEWIYSIQKIDDLIINSCFTMACNYNFYDLSKWLYSLNIVNLDFNNDYLFIECCKNDSLDTAEWLLFIGFIPRPKSYWKKLYYSESISKKTYKWLLQILNENEDSIFEKIKCNVSF
jgi:hypothetical protein